MQITADQFWQFGIAHYQRNGVKHACLCLQNHYQGNINLALLLIYLDQQKVFLNEEQIQTLIIALESSQTLILPYREMRKQLKSQLKSTGYQQLLNFELKLEQQQQEDLLRTVEAFRLAQNDADAQPGNLAYYCLQLGAEPLIKGLYGS
ncbi:TIGR02444 family protein [Thaumasiovibrio sp. DFM-14]|uniref:TIGR02444 family protein n=1 Tax=Thaumasiovibrio sp. DFM-14 TaxID=3384792 RepID=UPI0039A17AAA